MHEDLRCPFASAGGAGRPATQGGSGRSRRQDAGRSGPAVWCGAADGESLGSGVRVGWRPGAGRAEAWAATRQDAGRGTGGPHSAVDHRSPPRAAQAALRALDARGGAATDRGRVRRRGFDLDRGSLPARLGLHAAEAGAAGLGARSAGREPLAQDRVSGDPGGGEARQRRDLLGRRDGPAQRPRRRPLVCAAWPDADHRALGQPLRLQHDLGHHESRAPLLLGFFGGASRPACSSTSSNAWRGRSGGCCT